MLDQLIITIDPNADINKKKRWASKSGLSYAIDFNDITSYRRVSSDDSIK